MLRNISIINDLKKLDLSDYEEVIDDFIKTFSSYKINLFIFGNVKHPSISDLDLAIVYDEDLEEDILKDIIKKARFFIKKNEVNKYIFTHPILIYPAGIFQYIKFLHSFYNVKLLAGKGLKIINPSQEEKEILDEVHFINFTNNALYWLQSLKLSKIISLRHLLLALNSIKHSFVFLNNRTPNSNLIKWIEILENVRKNLNILNSLSINSLERTLFSCFNTFLINTIEQYIEFDAIKFLEDRQVYFLSSKGFIKIPALVLLHGASYWQCCKKKKSGYWQIHKLMYPINISFKNKIYFEIIKIQMQHAISFESLYEKYFIKPLIPLMCNYCSPKITFKQLLNLAMNNIFLKIQLKGVL